MKKTLQVSVLQPCHENWNAMLPGEKGSFCGACRKEVVDFSLMTDQQLLNYLSAAKGNTCGRFTRSQLQRNLVAAQPPAKKSRWLAVLMPLLLLLDKSYGQQPAVTPATAQYPHEKKPPNLETESIVSTLPSSELLDTPNANYMEHRRSSFQYGQGLPLASSIDIVIGQPELRRQPHFLWRDTAASYLRGVLQKRPFIVKPSQVKLNNNCTVTVHEWNDFNIEVFNAAGDFVYLQKCRNSQNLPVSIQAKWPKGVYYVRVLNERLLGYYTEKIWVK
ncbi:T9SS type A sorting domain-containing protein [Deminuibacter soli]|uniref:Uncharacterized protein n=1 Tax=Deminuibacter soli TaxID=2291815 RepID=A0A3E1NKZ5_9BACT|nr:hypothetical protein [Deminuibacter soli]RFM28605.1 hypothetical protein DXN05_07355 [Deminuibacter soli]